MRRCLLALVLLAAAVPAFSDTVDDTLRTHLAAIGGKDRVDAMSSMKAIGRTKTPSGESTFTMWAARPDLIRVETVSHGRTLIQVYNGKPPAYVQDTNKPHSGWHPMDFENGERFIADSDFDDPLVCAMNGRINADDAGFEEMKDGKRIKLLMTRGSEPAFFVLVDPETYLITERVDTRKSPVGGEVKIVTVYDDFRLDGGILTPHHVTVTEGTQLIQETWVDSVTPNVPTPPGLFAPPPSS